MPGRDGTGPRGVGPFTGRGAGNCAIVFPKSGRPYGYAGLQGALIGGFCRLRCLNPFRWLGRGSRTGGRGRRIR